MPEGLSEHVDADTADRAEFEPFWLRAFAFGNATAVASFGAVGLALAVAGDYRTYLVYPIGAVVWIALLALGRPVLSAPGGSPADRSPLRSHLVAGVAVAFSGAIAVWNASHASQHVLINRDGGAYTNAGRWIAGHGNLRVAAAVGPFAHQPSFTFGSFAMYPNAKGVLSFQFAHLLPALLAEAHDLGGDRLMFAATPLLGGLALLAFFVSAWRLLRNPYVALAALAAFAFVLPEVSFSRDAYSEIAMQLLLFTALWILADVRAFRRPRVALVVGIVLGLLQAARIDAIAVLTGLGLLFAIMWLVADAADRRSVAISSGACAIGLVPGVVLGFTDLSLRSKPYLADLRSNVNELGAAMVASIVLALILVAVLPRIARRMTRIPPVVQWSAAALVAAVGFGAWLARPSLQHVRGPGNALIGGLQQAAGVAFDPKRTYAERSMQWMSWYLGAVAVAAAIVAAALLVRRLLDGQMYYTLAGIALLGPASAVYLWRPNISTDQIWVMRRYLFSALPLVTLLAFGLVAALLQFAPKGIPRAVPVTVAIAIGAALLAYPIAVLKPVRNMTEQRGDVGALHDACRILGRDAAVVVLQSPRGLLSSWAPQSIRDWCNVPVAIVAQAVPGRATLLAQDAAQWSKAGRRLWVLADRTETIRGVFPAAKVRATRTVTNPYFLERTLLRRPSHYAPEMFSLVMAPVAPG